MVGYIVPYMEPSISSSTRGGLGSTTGGQALSAPAPPVVESMVDGEIDGSIYGTIYATIYGCKNDAININDSSRGIINVGGRTIEQP